MQVFTNVLLVVILFLLILDIIYLRRISKNPIIRTQSALDKRFYELKFEIRLIEAIAAVLLFVGTYLGISTKGEIKNAVEKEINKDLEPFKKGVLNNLKNVPKIFVVRDVLYNADLASREIGKGIRFYYKDLKTISGEELSDFRTPPLLLIQGDGAEFVVSENTTNYFDISLYVSSGSEGNNRNFKFGIWIVSAD